MKQRGVSAKAWFYGQPGFHAPRQVTAHTHSCRDCGASIDCCGDGDSCWVGGNSGCECDRPTSGSVFNPEIAGWDK